jgi:hypothetical protein
LGWILSYSTIALRKIKQSRKLQNSILSRHTLLATVEEGSTGDEEGVREARDVLRSVL